MTRTLTHLSTPVSFSHSQLVYFVRVAETGQISRAARMLYMAQPALSQAIAKLERQLGFALLERHPRGVTLTPAGEVFLAKARLALAAGVEAAALASSLAQRPGGELTIGFLSTPPPVSAPHVLDFFSTTHRDVAISFRELPFPTAPIAGWLGNVDLALCHSPVACEAVHVEALWSEPRALLMHESHPLAARAELCVADALDETFCGFHPSVDGEWAAFWTLDRDRGGPPRRMTGDTPANALELVAAVAARRCVSVGPFSVAQTIAGIVPQLAVRQLADAEPSSCALVWREPAQNPLTNAFVESAKMLLREIAA